MLRYIIKSVMVGTLALSLKAKAWNLENSKNNLYDMREVSIYHTSVSQSEMLNLISNDGASSYQSDFTGKVFVYKFSLIGGGGYYSSSLLRLYLHQTPIFVIGKGTSDDTAAYRVSIGVDTTNMYEFNNLGWVNLTPYWTSDSIFVLLDSRWGTNYDTELDLWMAFSAPLDTVITYDLIKYSDSFDSFTAYPYQVYVAPVSIDVVHGNSFSDDLASDGASSYQPNFTGNYAYRIDMWGGGGEYSDCLLKMYFSEHANYAIAIGTSDDNDDVLRTGIGKEVNHLVDVQQNDWVEVTRELQNNYVDFKLNSKWGTNHDSHIILWISTDNELQDLGYSISMFPDGFGSIEVKKYNLSGGNFTLPFSDDFNDGDDSDWLWFTWVGPYPGGQPSHEVANGVERIVTYDQNSTMLANGTSSLHNYFIEADERIVQLLDDAYGGLRLYAYSSGGFDSGNTYYMFDICYRESRWSLSVQYSDGTGERLAQGALDINLNQWYHMKIEVRGDTVYGYLDGQLLGSGVPSHPLSGGYFGFGGSDDIIEVDNVHADYVQQNNPPTATAPSGPSSGEIDQILTFSSTVTDPDDDQVYIQVSFGDGTTSEWMGSYPSGHTFNFSHSWDSAGIYCVKARGKDSQGNIGNWSSCKTVTINQPSSANDTLEIVSVNAAPGSNVTVPIKLKNPDLVGGIQFDIIFDSNVVTFDSIKLTERASGFSVGHNILGGDTLRVMIYTSSGDTIIPGSEAIANLFFSTSQSVNFGDSTLLALTNTLLSTPLGQPITVAEIDGWIRFTGRKGDVNQDGNINIFDVVRAVNIALQIPPSPTSYELWAADMNNDGRVNIFDVIQIVNVVLSGGKMSSIGNVSYILKNKINSKIQDEDTLRIPYIDGVPGGTVAIPIELVNHHVVGGIQLSVHFDPTVLSYTDSVILTDRATGMTIGANIVGGDTLILLIYSTTGDTISQGSGAIANAYFTISPDATGDSTLLSIYNPLLSDRMGQPIPVVGVNGWLRYRQQGPAADTLQLGSAWGAPGTSIQIPVVLNCQDPISGIQTTVMLDSSVLKFQNAYIDSQFSNFSVSYNNFGDSVKLIVVSMSGDSILPGSDTVLYLNFMLDSSATLGDSTYLTPLNTVLSDPAGNYLPSVSEGTWIYIMGTKGDLNQDGNVDVTDAVREINIILNRPPAPTPYEMWAGDMNNDGHIDVTDAVMIVNVIIGRGKNAIKGGSANLHVEDGKIILNSDCEIAGIQFDLIGNNVSDLTEGMDIGTFEMFTAKIEGGYRVIIMGMDGSVLSPGQVELLKFNGTAAVRNVVISDERGHKINLSDDRPSEIAVYSITPNPMKGAGYVKFELPVRTHVRVTLYNVTGRKLLNIANKEFDAGIHSVKINLRELPSGIYFVRIDAGREKFVKKIVLRK